VQDSGRDNLGEWAGEAVKIRAQFTADEKITAVESTKKGSNSLETAVVAAGAVALGALAAAAFSPRSKSSSPSPSFTPRAPWCSTNDYE
jgi:hypothetical protein